jgi:Domain of Unknown Function with PDB structure (DUF3857)
MKRFVAIWIAWVAFAFTNGGETPKTVSSAPQKVPFTKKNTHLQVPKSLSDDEEGEWKKVSMEEMKMTSTPAFPDAEAVVLFDVGSMKYGLSNQRPMAKIIVNRHVRIKILNDKGAKNARISIGYPKNGYLVFIQGRTYNLDENGKIDHTRLKSHDIIDDRSNSETRKLGTFKYEANQDTSLHYKHLFLPNVSAGSVFEYRYELHFDSYETLTNWYFQQSIPVLRASLTTILPNFYNYTNFMHGSVSLDSMQQMQTIDHVKGFLPKAAVLYSGMADPNDVMGLSQINSSDMAMNIMNNAMRNTAVQTSTSRFLDPSLNNPGLNPSQNQAYNPSNPAAKSNIDVSELIPVVQTYFLIKNVPPLPPKPVSKEKISHLTFSLQSYNHVNALGVSKDEQWFRVIENIRSNGMSTLSRWSPSTLLDNYKSNPMRIVFPGESNQLNIRYQLAASTDSWESLNQLLLTDPNFGKRIRSHRKFQKVIEQLIQPSDSAVGKMIDIYRYVQQNVRWNGEYALYAKRPLWEVLEERKGNSAEINLLLIALLKEAQLDAAPLAMSTQSNGFLIKTLPDARRLNQVLCSVLIGERPFLLDATDFLRGYNLLDAEDINAEGWRVDKTNFGWQEIPHNVSKQFTIAKMQLNNNGNLEGAISYHQTDYIALRKRREIYEKQLESKLQLVFEKKMKDVVVQQMAFLNLTDFDKPLIANYKFLTLDFVEKKKDTLVLQPMMMEQIKAHPFYEDSISEPIQLLYPEDNTYVLTLDIPKDYEVVSFPEAVDVSFNRQLSQFLLNEGKDPRVCRFVYKVESKLESQLRLSCLIKIFRNEVYPHEYLDFKAFYENLVKKQSEKIILRKKN